MDIAVVILNWNAASDTIRVVSEVSSWRKLTPTIIVVDNASMDNSVEVIHRECPGIHLICNDKNLGFTGGTNRGILHALELGKAPILLLNNDASIAENDVGSLLDTLRDHADLGFVGPLLFDAEHPHQLISAGGKNPIKHHQTRLQSIAADRQIQLVENVSGTVVLIRPEVFETVGLLDENYFFSTELADLCMKAKQNGFLSAINTQARAYHAVSRSSNLRETLYVYYIVRNRFIFIRNSPDRPKFLYYAFWTLYSLALTLKLKLTNEQASAQAVWLGMQDGLKGRFGGQNERVLSACFPDSNQLVQSPS